MPPSHHIHDRLHSRNPLDGGPRDPVCGMAVTPPSPFNETYEGKTYQFCSFKCQEKFRIDPKRYAQHKADSPHASHPGPSPATQSGSEFTCPMHPETRQPGPGICPKCGMALEPVMPPLDEEDNPELKDFTRRFWWTLPLTVIVTVLAMTGHSLQLFHGMIQNWVELVLATPVTLWAGWPFCQGGSICSHRSPNMWTLISLGTASAYLYSVVATLLPQSFPATFSQDGRCLLRSRRCDQLAHTARSNA